MEDKRSILIVSLAALILLATAIPVAYVATQEKDGGVEMITITITSTVVDISDHFDEFKDALESEEIGGTDVHINPDGDLQAHIPKGTTHDAVAEAVDGIGGDTMLCTPTGSSWNGMHTPVEDKEIGELTGE